MLAVQQYGIPPPGHTTLELYTSYVTLPRRYNNSIPCLPRVIYRSCYTRGRVCWACRGGGGLYIPRTSVPLRTTLPKLPTCWMFIAQSSLVPSHATVPGTLLSPSPLTIIPSRSLHHIPCRPHVKPSLAYDNHSPVTSSTLTSHLCRLVGSPGSSPVNIPTVTLSF